MVQSKIQLYPLELGVPPGLIKDKPAYLLPDGAYQELKNARLLNRTLKKAVGWTLFDNQDLGARVMHIDQLFKSDGTDYLVIYTTAGMFVWNTGTSTFDSIIATAFTGTLDELFSVDVGFDLIVSANDIDTVRKYDGTGTEAVLGGLDDVEYLDGTPTIAVDSAAAIRYFKNFFVLFNVIENGTRKPSRVRWSRLGLPENWKNDSDGSGQAGATDIGDVDWILTGERLGDTMVIYKERSIWLMTYEGPPTIFNFREKIGGLGPVGPQAVASLGDEHMFVGNDEIYFFNGETVDPVGDPVRKFFFDNVDPSEIGKTNIFIAEEDNEAIIAFVSSASSNGIMDKAIVYNYIEKTWSYRELSASCFGYYRRTANLTWATATGTLDVPGEPGIWDDRQFLDNAPINLFGTNSGYVYKFEGVSLAGVAQELQATTKIYDFKTPDKFKRIQRLQVLASKVANSVLKIRIGSSENMDDDPTWSETFEYDLSTTENPFVDIDVSGRFFTFEITHDDNTDFEGTGIIVHYILKGTK